MGPSHASKVVQRINGGSNPNASLASECRAIVEAIGYTLRNILQAGNKVTDKMATIGAQREDDRRRLLSLLTRLRNSWQEDKLGIICYPS